MRYDFESRVWVWDARQADTWTFASLPVEESAEIRALWDDRGAGDIPRGFGSVKVTATIGATSWRTSIFPSKGGVYVLPLKKAVRTAEGIAIDDLVAVRLDLDL
jgi:hypothetical protein